MKILKVKSIDYRSGNIFDNNQLITVFAESKVFEGFSLSWSWECADEISKKLTGKTRDKKINFTIKELDYKQGLKIKFENFGVRNLNPNFNHFYLNYVFTDKRMDYLFEENLLERLDWHLKKRSTICFVEYY